MKLTDQWFTVLADDGTGQCIYISGRDDIDGFIRSGQLTDRIEVTWTYEADSRGLPADDAEAKLMEEVEAKLRTAMERTKFAILTGIYSGAGRRQWIFLARSNEGFGRRLNEALAVYPQRLPIEIYAEKDPDNDEYRELLALKHDED